jgi:TPR repeat protein
MALQFMVGLLHDRGEGVPQDRKEAVKWYRRAAEQGMTEAGCPTFLRYN